MKYIIKIEVDGDKTMTEGVMNDIADNIVSHIENYTDINKVTNWVAREVKYEN